MTLVFLTLLDGCGDYPLVFLTLLNGCGDYPLVFLTLLDGSGDYPITGKSLTPVIFGTPSCKGSTSEGSNDCPAELIRSAVRCYLEAKKRRAVVTRLAQAYEGAADAMLVEIEGP